MPKYIKPLYYFFLFCRMLPHNFVLMSIKVYQIVNVNKFFGDSNDEIAKWKKIMIVMSTF